MRILFTHRYFWPDTPPYANLLRVLAGHFADTGNDVGLFASQPSYRKSEPAPKSERLDGFRVNRVSTLQEAKGNMAARLLNTLVYCAALFVHIVKTRADIVVAATFPPIVAAWTASIAARIAGAAFVYHMQDVHPEVSQNAGGFLGRGLPFRFMRWLDNGTLRRASAIIVLSQDMANTVSARMPSRSLPIHVINNFELSSFDNDEAPPADLAKPAHMRRAIFAGNMGKFQDLGTFVEGIVRGFDDIADLEVLLLGDGEAKADLEKQFANEPRVRFGPFLPYAQAKALIADADLGLVSLMPGICNVSYPSKVLTYIGLGLPMLALVEPNSSLADDIESNGLGAVPANRQADAIADAVKRALSDQDARAKVAAYHKAETSRKAVLAKWQSVFTGLAKGQGQ
jgi:glycosyltransferase involved in cell wall biosynthesis